MYWRSRSAIQQEEEAREGDSSYCSAFLVIGTEAAERGGEKGGGGGGGCRMNMAWRVQTKFSV